MNEYIPQYAIIDHEDMVPRDQIRIVPEGKLEPLDRAELSRLREGKVGYKLVVADTPENRQNIGVKTTYFQMVAYAEGWEFNPDKYQVQFVEPDNPLLTQDGSQKRIWEFDEGAGFGELSPERRAGFTVRGEYAERMRHKETDGLAGKVLKLFRN
jgi:hypothetical protein